jgi:hypothetical protein
MSLGDANRTPPAQCPFPLLFPFEQRLLLCAKDATRGCTNMRTISACTAPAGNSSLP